MIMTARIIPVVIVFLVACLVSLVLTALLRRLAFRIGLTDLPDGRRKLHEHPVPLGGGVAVFLSLVGVVGALWVVPNQFRPDLWQKLPGLPALLLAGTVIVIVGLIDDCVRLRGRDKLLGQLVAATILMVGGLLIHGVGIFGYKIELGWFAIPVTLFWLLGAMNALNLLDGIDGLATMLGIILVATVAAIAYMTGRIEVAIVASVFAGSLLGFLRFNFPPATIFLGDSGSMLIGLVVGALAIQGSLKGPGTVLLAAPLAVWTIPIFDSVAAILRRKLTGRSIYTTDRGHLHHRLLNLLGSNRKVLAWLAASCMVTSAAALLSVFLHNDLIALLTCSAIVIIFIATGVFGRVELLLLGSRLRRVGQLLVPPFASGPAKARQTIIRLQGSRQWELLWEAFSESAEKLSLSEVHLDVNLPAVEEGYHASWERPRREDLDPCWRLELPLMVANQSIGSLVIVGQCNQESACDDIQRLLDLIEPFEARLSALSREELPVPTAEDALAVAEGRNDQVASVQTRKHPK